jgi:peptidoglycan-N-acetylglucosamine deacetylase
MKSMIKQLIPEALLMRRLPKSHHRRVLLTFDDGPTPGVTESVMDKLEEFNTSAIFFMVGEKIQKHPELAKQISDRGHTIGNHTFSHNLDSKNSAHEIDLCQDILHQATGNLCKFYRHPAGSINLKSLFLPKQKGLQYVHWSCDPLDWDCKSNNDGIEAANRLLKSVKPGDIILLHDFDYPVLALLDVALPELKKRDLLQQPGEML